MVGSISRFITSSLQDIHNVAVKGISKILQDFGVIRSSNLELLQSGFLTCSTIIEQKLYFKYFPHFVAFIREFHYQSCHYIGLDNNDTPSISTTTPLVSGVAFCIEPGVYVRDNGDGDLICSLMEVKRYLKSYVILVFVQRIQYCMLTLRVLMY